MRKKALTLLEIIISIVILSLVVTGLANLFILGKRYILHSRSRMSGIELGKPFLDYLQMAVRADTWADADNPLQTGTRYCDSSANPQQPGCPSETERTLEPITYDAQYTITRDSPISNINKVTVNITWSEPSP